MNTKNLIFISHRTTDKVIADMLLDFLTATGIPRNLIKCSSLPGNDVIEKISSEVRSWIKQSAVNIAILSDEYYKSSYCLNEAGILWYLENTPIIAIALPGITPDNMVGFLNSDCKIHRLDCDTDIAAIYDLIQERIDVKSEKHTVIAAETKKLKQRYTEFCEQQKKQQESENIYENDDVWIDGYHEVKDLSGNIKKKGQFLKGKLVDGIMYDIVLKISKRKNKVEEREPTEEETANFLDGLDYDVWKEKHLEEPVQKEHIKDEKWTYSECGQYENTILLLPMQFYIRKFGLEYFYVVDKKVNLEGKIIKPTFTNFRTLKEFLAEKNPDELEYLTTGKFGLEEAASAEVE